ncbi:MAG TPA: hypothetical protein VGN25_03845 [Solirubrobacteraceae bacterium]|nr:hypothetical protein [Solirubrobacteraceae bacterium]
MSALERGAGVSRHRLAPAWVLTSLLAVVYLLIAPASPDLAAASYRADLFSRVGFTLWDNSWYGGHHLPAYSLLAPALSVLLAPRLVAALSMVAATALFSALIAERFPRSATQLAGAWFALGAGFALLSSRVPFDLGMAIALGSALAAQRRLMWVALGLALLSAIASPVAGAFLALAFLAWALAGPQRAWPAALTLAALAPIGLLTVVFPEGGTQPFVASAYFPALVGVIVLAALIPSEQRELRLGAALYVLALTGSYLLSTAVGGNADRLGAQFAGPLAACVLMSARPASRHPWRGRALIVLAPFLLYWQVNAPLADFAAASSNPSVEASYYAPLLSELHTLGLGYGARAARIEAVASSAHWEARWLAPHVMLARGWERQLDVQRNKLFYGPSTPLTAARYQQWLASSAVSYVALSDAPLDYSARAEARLLRAGGLSFLREVWRSPHWRLFAVLGATPLVQAPASVRSVSTDSLSVYMPRAGNYEVRVRFTPYWALAAGKGCVASAGGPEEWTDIRAQRPGSFRLVIDFSLGRVLSRGSRCR